MYKICSIIGALILAVSVTINAMEPEQQQTNSELRKKISFLEGYMRGTLTVSGVSAECRFVAHDFEGSPLEHYQCSFQDACSLLRDCLVVRGAEQAVITPIIEKLQQASAVEQKRAILSSLTLEEKWELQKYYYICFIDNKDLKDLCNAEQVEEIIRNRQKYAAAFLYGSDLQFSMASSNKLHLESPKELNKRIQNMGSGITTAQTTEDIIKLITFDTTAINNLPANNNAEPNSIQSIGFGLAVTALTIAASHVFGK